MAVTALRSGKGDADLPSTVAFSILFLVPAAVSVVVWIVLWALDSAIGLGELGLFPWLVLVVSPGIVSAAIAQWACRQSGTAASTAWRFSIAAAVITPLFVAVAAAWLLNAGE